MNNYEFLIIKLIFIQKIESLVSIIFYDDVINADVT